jgi:hypothetical protein
MVKVNRFRFEKSAGVFIRIRILETIDVKQVLEPQHHPSLINNLSMVKVNRF